MNRYDPDRAPDPKEWLDLDELKRIDLVYVYHRMARIKMPNVRAHAAFHAIVENQIAMNIEPVVRAMGRLMTEGLSRHEAVHAVASLVAIQVHSLSSGAGDPVSAQAKFDEGIEKLTAQRWLDGSIYD